MRFGLFGKSGVGKSTVANYLRDKYGYKVYNAWEDTLPKKLPPKAVVVGKTFYDVCRNGEGYVLIVEVVRDNPYVIPKWERPDAVLVNPLVPDGNLKALHKAVDNLLSAARKPLLWRR